MQSIFFALSRLQGPYILSLAIPGSTFLLIGLYVNHPFFVHAFTETRIFGIVGMFIIMICVGYIVGKVAHDLTLFCVSVYQLILSIVLRITHAVPFLRNTKIYTSLVSAHHYAEKVHIPKNVLVTHLRQDQVFEGMYNRAIASLSLSYALFGSVIFAFVTFLDYRFYFLVLLLVILPTVFFQQKKHRVMMLELQSVIRESIK